MKAALLAATIAWAGTADVRGVACSRLGVRQGSLVQTTCLALRAARDLPRGLGRGLPQKESPMKPFISLETDTDVVSSPSPNGHQWRTRAKTRAWLVSDTGSMQLACKTSREGCGDSFDEAQANAMRAAIAEAAAHIRASPWADTYREIYVGRTVETDPAVERVAAEEQNPKLAQQLALKRLQVSILEGRIRDCPHDCEPVSEVVETSYAKGFTFEDGPRPPINHRVTTSVCRRCGTTTKTRERDHG